MDIEKVGKICRENNLIFIVDASQSAGSIPIDIERQNIERRTHYVGLRQYMKNVRIEKSL